MDARFTPGPFVAGQSENQRAHGQWSVGLHDAGDGNVSGCDYTDANRPYMSVSGICTEGDARRFAASPDMLEALQAALSAANEIVLTSSVFPRQQIEAAIAKATGAPHEA